MLWKRASGAFPAEGISRRRSPAVEEWVLRSGPADPTPSDAFPRTEYVALLAMVRFSHPASPCGRRASHRYVRPRQVIVAKLPFTTAVSRPPNTVLFAQVTLRCRAVGASSMR